LLGLSYLAKGDTLRAIDELDGSMNVPESAVMRLQGPSMALAKALLPEQRGPVAAYLDKCSHTQWKDKDKAAAWKAEATSGKIPDFGTLGTIPVAPAVAP
jgi:hypothetical protein